MSRFSDLLGKVFRGIGDYVADRVPKGASLEYDAQQMLQALDLKADAVSFAMARADEKFARLREEMENHDALGRQAAQFLRESDQTAAERCVTLKLQSAKLAAKLREEYTTLQQEAEELASRFLDQRRVIEAKVALIPELRDDERLNQTHERVNHMLQQFNLDSAEQAFDRTAREINIRKKQLLNRQLLLADPNAELDSRIRESLKKGELTTAMSELKAMVEAGAVDTDFEVIKDDSIQETRKLLLAPRYKGILPSGGTNAGSTQETRGQTHERR